VNRPPNELKEAVQNLEIRSERSADVDSIRRVTELAFKGRPYADGDEQDVIDRLRTVAALTLSLVAVRDDTVIGHIAFSPAWQSDSSAPWYTLGPVSVLPGHQGMGVGTELIVKGLSELRALQALGCILTGNPAYYRRFGFEFSNENAPENEPAEFFMLNLFTGVKPTGRFRFHDAFYGDV